FEVNFGVIAGTVVGGISFKVRFGPDGDVGVGADAEAVRFVIPVFVGTGQVAQIGVLAGFFQAVVVVAFVETFTVVKVDEAPAGRRGGFVGVVCGFFISRVIRCFFVVGVFFRGFLSGIVCSIRVFGIFGVCLVVSVFRLRGCR